MFSYLVLPTVAYIYAWNAASFRSVMLDLQRAAVLAREGEEEAAEKDWLIDGLIDGFFVLNFQRTTRVVLAHISVRSPNRVQNHNSSLFMPYMPLYCSKYRRKMKEKEPGSQKLEPKNPWQQSKHAKL